MKDQVIVNDFLPDFYYNYLFSSINSNTFPWYFLNSASGWDSNIKVNDATFPKNQTGLFHLLYNIEEGGITSSTYDMFAPVMELVSEKFNLNVQKLIRIRLGLTLNSGQQGSHHPHVDRNFPHKTLLYYFNDSDGDTIFYNKKFGEDISDGLSVSLKNTPKKNQAVLFDGLQYHSSSFPTQNDYRMTMNINFIDDESIISQITQ